MVELALAVLFRAVVALVYTPLLVDDMMPDDAPVPIVAGAVVRGAVTVEDVELTERIAEEVELIITIVEDDTPVLRGIEVTPVPVGPTTMVEVVPFP